jgi:transposase-like protein
MATATKKKISPEVKLAILKSYFIDKVSISELSEKYQIQPSNIYNWQSQLFTNGAITFERRNDRTTGSGASARMQKHIEILETKLAQKNEVVAELLEEHVKLKKHLGVI